MSPMEECPTSRDELRNVIIDKVPERCHDCPVIGKYATAYAILLETGRLKPADRRALARLTFSRTGTSCPKGVDSEGACGSRV